MSENLQNAIEISHEAVSVLEIHNASLFARFCLSLLSNFEDSALEQAVLSSAEGKELSFKNSTIIFPDLLSVDLNDKRIVALLISKALKLVEEDEEIRVCIEQTNYRLQEKIEDCLIQLQTDCDFLVDWDFAKYCKALGLSVDVSLDITLFDKAIHLLQIAADLFPEKILCFVNLKTFLTIDEYDEFCKMAIYNKLYCLLFEHENMHRRLYEKKLVIDEDFLEIRG